MCVSTVAFFFCGGGGDGGVFLKDFGKLHKGKKKKKKIK